MNTQEEKRLRVLHNYNILDTEAEDSFDNLAKLAAQICGTQASQINFIGSNRQWAKATIGWGKEEMPRAIGFCTHTIGSKNLKMVVPDTLKDVRFADNPLVKGEPPLRFYAGVAIKSDDGHPLGALCVYHSEPKTLTDQQLESLRILADQVETNLKLRITQDQLKEDLAQENKFNQKIIDFLPINFFMYNKSGKPIRWNDNVKYTTGYSDKEIKSMHPVDYFEDDDRDLVTRSMEEVFKGKQVSFEADIIDKKDKKIPFIFSASSFEMNNETYLIGTGQDITKLKETLQKLTRSLKEKDVILAELHHRVKNNLAAISGIMQLEMLETEDAKIEKSLSNTFLRIQTMAEVHEVMYQKENLAYVDFHRVVETIAENIRTTYGNSDNIALNIEVDKIDLNVNQAIPCGLIINELLINAWKHAYPNKQEGLINLEMRENDSTIVLQIADGGKGLPKGVGPNEGGTLGFTLVKNFCSQLYADLNINQQKGTEYIIQFEKKDTKGASNSLNFQYN